MKLLLIEDDTVLADIIKEQLQKENHIIDVCYSGDDGLTYALDSMLCYELAIIDRMLPVIDGLTITKAMREKKIQIPIILITGMSELNDKVEGLDCGADDYLVKPFHIRELSARIRALQRRPIHTQDMTILQYGDLSLEYTKHQLQCHQYHETLTPKEFLLLAAFMKTPDTILTRDQLLAKAWDSGSDIEMGNVDNYIYFLRKRLKAIHSTVIIRSVYGSGYILEESHD